ncbi:hypothetical protein GUITHDRAFT_103735 [Guillardia theta CCMP2712]|uniref:EF-hand domain-containing protein n=1 Tax=Guillardia theta (strain CCMP2712) TaxID=905079 RepID=L1JQY7_GUITC|nr:hypothetical protein GUITHDRAFT_103735 [Guillardia theta CCMP2712]EKX50503.1 hypothetical protein GUITHDRAFT_103735 [Guillardia theta CCMP2712]|eukprot:XP_005837483.1 hypothetical protein GUITHDRAFT_103735 [Guillardia theta CCMP2712]
MSFFSSMNKLSHQGSLPALQPQAAQAETLHGVDGKARRRLHIPQAAVFVQGVLTEWYFHSRGRIMKKAKKSLEKENLLKEFARENSAGRPVAYLIVHHKGEDGLFTTQVKVLEENGFNSTVRNAFSTQLTGTVVEYVVGKKRPVKPWLLNPPLDPRTEGAACFECVWTKERISVKLRHEDDLKAVAHTCFQHKDNDGRIRFDKPRTFIQHVRHELGAQQGQSLKPIKAVGQSFKRFPAICGYYNNSTWRVMAEGDPSKVVYVKNFRSWQSRDTISGQAQEDEGPQLGGPDYSEYGNGVIISLEEHSAIRDSLRSLVHQLELSQDGAGESPKVKHLLAFFKRSRNGHLYLIWSTAALLFPSENMSNRKFVSGTKEFSDYTELLQNLVIHPGWYNRFCSSEDDVEKGLLKAFDLRSTTMDFKEFLNFLNKIGLLPRRITREEAGKIFRRANRTKGVSDDDVYEMSFNEFKSALKLIVDLLGLEWRPILCAARIGEILFNPKVYKRFCFGEQGNEIHFNQLCNLLLTYRLLPAFISKEDAEKMYRRTLREQEGGGGGVGGSSFLLKSAQDSPVVSSPAATHHTGLSRHNSIIVNVQSGLHETGFRAFMIALGDRFGMQIDKKKDCVISPFTEQILGSQMPPEMQSDSDVVERLYHHPYKTSPLRPPSSPLRPVNLQQSSTLSVSVTATDVSTATDGEQQQVEVEQVKERLPKVRKKLKSSVRKLGEPSNGEDKLEPQKIKLFRIRSGTSSPVH